MANWRKLEESDLAAMLSQGEIDGYRADGALDGSDPVLRLLSSTAARFRGAIGASGGVRMGPEGSIPASLVIPAADYAMGKVLVRLNIPLNDDRRRALEKAEELLADIAAGRLDVESYSEEDEIPPESRRATFPDSLEAHPERLLD